MRNPSKSGQKNALDMVGVRGSIPLVPTISDLTILSMSIKHFFRGRNGWGRSRPMRRPWPRRRNGHNYGIFRNAMAQRVALEIHVKGADPRRVRLSRHKCEAKLLML